VRLPDTQVGTSPAPRLLRLWVALVASPLVFFAVNALDVWWLRGSDFSSNAFYDGFAACLTIALPAFLSGLALGFLLFARRVVVALAGFGILSLASIHRPCWQIPPVSPQSAQSGVMHYFLYSPLALLSFGLLGAWLAEQFALGRFKLADDTPVSPARMGDD